MPCWREGIVTKTWEKIFMPSVKAFDNYLNVRVHRSGSVETTICWAVGQDYLRFWASVSCVVDIFFMMLLISILSD